MDVVAKVRIPRKNTNISEENSFFSVYSRQYIESLSIIRKVQLLDQ